MLVGRVDLNFFINHKKPFRIKQLQTQKLNILKIIITKFF